jgi:SAM-dependent methyltransferase
MPAGCRRAPLACSTGWQTGTTPGTTGRPGQRYSHPSWRACFAAALGAEVGVDPAAGPLAQAAVRGIQVVRGAGEQLPFRSGVLGAVLTVMTVCFADDPAALLAEARRVIRDDGAVVLGEVFAGSAWGRFYQDKAARGHPFYSPARFLSRDQALALVTAAGLRVQAARSTLCQRPTDSPRPEPARDGEAEAAGFITWRAVPTGPSSAR